MYFTFYLVYSQKDTIIINQIAHYFSRTLT